MEKILDLLANNYIWFLIAAFVLAVILVIFLSISKKKGKSEGGKGETIENISSELSVEAPAAPAPTPVEATPTPEVKPAEPVAEKKIEPAPIPKVEPVVTPSMPEQPKPSVIDSPVAPTPIETKTTSSQTPETLNFNIEQK